MIDLPAQAPSPDKVVGETVTQQELAELIERDPLELSDRDLEILCAKLRDMRILWEKEKAVAKATGKKPKPVKGTVSFDVGQIKLELS